MTNESIREQIRNALKKLYIGEGQMQEILSLIDQSDIVEESNSCTKEDDTVLKTDEKNLEGWGGWQPTESANAVRKKISEFLDANLISADKVSKFLDINPLSAEYDYDLKSKAMSLIEEYAVQTASDAVDSFAAYTLGQGVKLYGEEWTP